MFIWLLKTIWKNKGSFLTSTLAIAFAFSLVIVINAVFEGESRQIIAYIDNMHADVWVMQSGVGNMHMASSFINNDKIERVKSVNGVKSVSSILYSASIVRAANRNWFSYILGFDGNNMRAGPWSMQSGSADIKPGEIILPHVMAQTTGLTLGDEAIIANKQFRISGFTNETFSMANSVVFVHLSDLQDLLDIHNSVSYILVDAESGVNKNELAKTIQQTVNKVSVLTHEEFVQNDYQLAILMGVEIVFFMSIIASTLAALIISFTTYSMVIRRSKELAIAKALGFNNKAIYAAVLLQTAILTCLAFIITLIICSALLPFLSATQPMLTFVITADSIVELASIAMLIAIFSSLIPAVSLSRVDPVTAFKV